MTIRYKRPDAKNAFSLVTAATQTITFTYTLTISEQSGATIVRNIYESFRMLGDALLVAQGIESDDHLLPIKELVKLQVNTDRPINLLDNLRRLRHNINYYGYTPNVAETEDVISIAKSCFGLLRTEVLKKIQT